MNRDEAGPANKSLCPRQTKSLVAFATRPIDLKRKLNAERWKALQQSPQFNQMKEAGNMGISIPYTLNITVPRPVKKVDNQLAKLFPDRKKVIMQYNLVEVFEHPEKFEYTIVY